jgi:ABC-type transporter Mla maintaining outer membrane lipid asymmetry ATPase subunit MlaF
MPASRVSTVCFQSALQSRYSQFDRVAGVDSHKERALVQRSAEMVELDGDAMWKMAKDLSGGMKR